MPTDPTPLKIADFRIRLIAPACPTCGQLLPPPDERLGRGALITITCETCQTPVLTAWDLAGALRLVALADHAD